MVISNIMRLEMAENSAEMIELKDYRDIQEWSKGAIGAVLDNGYMKGYTDQTFKTGNPITRAEATVALNNVVGSIYNKAGTYGDTTVAGNVSVSSDGVTLKNLNIKGDLYLTEGIGNGTVTLDNVTVDGKTLVCGGGIESIIIKNSTLGATVVQKKDGKVRLEASGKTKVGKMQIRSGGKLEEKDLSGVGFEDVEVKKDKSDAIVQFDGDFNNVDILSESKIEVTKGNIAKLQANEGAKDAEIKVLAGKIEIIEIKVKVKVEVSGGTIAKVTMDKASTGAVLDVKEGATITSLVTEAVIEVLGKGKVEVADVKINGVKFEVEPVKVVAANDVKVQIGPDPTSAPTTVAVVTPTPTKTTSGGSSGGSSGGGGTTTEDDVKLEITYSSNESVHVTVYNEDDNVYLENLTIRDFTLKLNRVSVDLDFIGTIINEDENDEVVEYVIKPVEMLEIGEYTLTFSKTGYYSTSEQFKLDKYSVVFDTNVGETGINRIIYSVAPGETLSDMLQDPTREGYTFVGWASEYDATEADFVGAEEINGNVLVYAVWQEVNAVTPVITADLTNKTTLVGTAVTLDATATVTDGGTLSYVWYSATAADKTGAEVVAGATNSTYAPVVSTAGTFYYYCEVTNTNNAATGIKTATVTSAVATVRITTPITAIGEIVGEAKERVELTAGALTPAEATVSYQWQIANTANGVYTKIDGAVTNKYTPVEGDIGKFIKVIATGIGNYSGTITSSATSEVVEADIAIIDEFVIFANYDEMGIWLYKSVSDEVYKIDDVTSGDFKLYKDYEMPGKVEITGFTVEEFGSEESNEYKISPANGTKFAAGNYTLFFDKEGYKTASIEIFVPVSVTGVELDQTELTLTVGDTVTLNALVLPDDATYKDIKWRTSDSEVATVNEDGEVTAIAVGTATIKVETADGYFTAECEVTVNAEVSAISVTGDAVVGATLTATLTPAGATGTYQWTICDAVDGTYEDITGETEATYTLAAGDAGMYIKVVATGTGNYTGTVPSDTTAVVGIFATPIDYEAPGELEGISNTVALFGTTFADEGASENPDNWTIDTGDTNLQVSSITRTGDNGVTINYTLIEEGEGTGYGTITINANAAAVEAGVNTNVVNVVIEADTTAPVLSNPIFSDVLQESVKLSYTSSEAGYYYYIVYLASDQVPTKEDVKAQTNGLVGGTGAHEAGSKLINITEGLDASTAYKAYVVVEDAAGNLSDVLTIEFTTLDVSVSTISVSGTDGATTITANGGTLQMIAGVDPVDATDPSVTWSVTNEDGTATDKATISNSGLLTAVKNGTVKVVATAQDGSGIVGNIVITISGQVVVDTAAYDAAVLLVPADNGNGTYSTPSWALFAAAIAECDLTLTAADGQDALDAEVLAIQAALDLLVEV